jgi:ABC-2 type transport system ATP-binding protein
MWVAVMSNILEVIDLEHRFDGQVALAGVSFHVAEGERFGLLGPNGAGKTTLLSIISSLLEPTAGAVQIAGRRLHPGDRELRRLIGIVPQDLAIYEELTARENLAFFGGLYGFAGADLERRVADVLREIGLDGSADARTAGLSWGMKRRLNLAAALVHGPRLLLLDEPTTGVDPQSRNQIFAEVRRLNGAGVTIVYTSHYMEEVQALCERVGIIDHGRLIACDTLPALLKQMRGVLRFRVRELTPAIREKVAQLPGTRLTAGDGQMLELECDEVRPTLLRLAAALQELGIEMTGLEMREPNLERVFLHLTGHGLRD